MAKRQQFAAGSNTWPRIGGPELLTPEEFAKALLFALVANNMRVIRSDEDYRRGFDRVASALQKVHANGNPHARRFPQNKYLYIGLYLALAQLQTDDLIVQSKSPAIEFKMTRQQAGEMLDQGLALTIQEQLLLLEFARTFVADE